MGTLLVIRVATKLFSCNKVWGVAKAYADISLDADFISQSKVKQEFFDETTKASVHKKIIQSISFPRAIEKTYFLKI